MPKYPGRVHVQHYLVTPGTCVEDSGNAEISSELFLSLKTVQNHVSNIFRKLQVADRAREAGLGESP